MDHAPVFIARCDREARFQFVNRGYAERFGLLPEQIVGKTVAEVLGPDGYEAIRPYIDMVLSGQQVEYDLEVPYRDLGRRYMRCVYEPERDAAGEVQGWVAVINDITDRRQAEETTALLGAIVESSQDAIVSKTLSGRILSWNFGAEQLFGYTASEAIGRPITMLIPPELHGDEQSILERLSRGERIELYETVRITKAGRLIDVSLSISPLRDRTGRILGASKVARDITARKRAERNARFLADAGRALAELTDYESTLQNVAALAVPAFADCCAVHMRQADGVLRRLAITCADPEKVGLVERIDGRAPQYLSDQYGASKVACTGEPDWCSDLAGALQTESAQDDPEGSQLILELGWKSHICVPLVVRGNTIGTITFLAIAGRSYSSDDLTVAQDLAQRAAIAIENANLYREVRQADRRKDEFLAMLGHELRNPLAPLHNALALIRSGDFDHETVQLMERQIEHMARLVDDLLDISRIMQGKIELRKQPVSLAVVIDRALEIAAPMIAAGDHELTASLPSEAIWLNGDPVRLTEVLTNLLHNAAKYSDPGGHIWLTVEREGEEGAVIKVRDKGIGVDADLLPEIFDLFTQAERSIERAQGGLGIGLTLVRTMVELHGGSVSVTSGGRGQGSEFTVRLPVLAQSFAAESDEVKPNPTRKLRVLVVEDMVGAARVLGKMLNKFWGHTVELAHDGIAAVETAKAFRPELILLDLGLPRLNGYEVARNLREHAEFDGTLLVALTGYGQESDRRRSAEAGFDWHLTKPPSVAMLEEVFAHPKLSGSVEERMQRG